MAYRETLTSTKAKRQFDNRMMRNVLIVAAQNRGEDGEIDFHTVANVLQLSPADAQGLYAQAVESIMSGQIKVTAPGPMAEELATVTRLPVRPQIPTRVEKAEAVTPDASPVAPGGDKDTTTLADPLPVQTGSVEALVVDGLISTEDQSGPQQADASRTLWLGPNFPVPLNAATESLAILAVKGAGKSNAAAVLVEELYDVGVPWVVIDPKGDWWGIAKSEANPDGLPIVVMGGIKREGYRHIRLSFFDGRKVAQMIVQRNLTCVVDICHMDDKDKGKFLADLGEELFDLHLHNPVVRHVVIEEAHEVIPQTGGPREVIKAWTRVVTQGRNRGIGITLVSQRSALVHKNVLTQTGSLIALRTPSIQDRKVIKDWTSSHDVSDELVKSLDSLDNGEAWVVAPHWLGVVKRVRFRRRRTYDSGNTPETVAGNPQVLTDDDLASFDEFLNGRPFDPGEVSDGESALASEQAAHGLTVNRVEADLPLGDPHEIMLAMIRVQPRACGELMRVTGLSVGRIRRHLRSLRDEGLIHMVGSRGGAKYCPGPVEDVSELDLLSATEVQEEVRDGAETPQLTDLTPVMQTAVSELANASQEALATLAELDQQADLLLRAQYLALLFQEVKRRIEAGSPDPELLDRFERVAGFVG